MEYGYPGKLQRMAQTRRMGKHNQRGVPKRRVFRPTVMGRSRRHLLFASFSPNLHTLVGRTHHGTLVWNSKSTLQLRQVAERSIDPKFWWAVRIDLQEKTACLPTSIVSPNLRPREEESLFGCEFVDLLVLFSPCFSFQRLFQGSIGHLNPA